MSSDGNGIGNRRRAQVVNVGGSRHCWIASLEGRGWTRDDGSWSPAHLRGTTLATPGAEGRSHLEGGEKEAMWRPFAHHAPGIYVNSQAAKFVDESEVLRKVKMQEGCKVS